LTESFSPRVFIAICIVVATGALVLGILIAGITDKYAANRDFIEYWAAAQQLVQHQNPYDSAATLHLERGAGMMESDPQVTLSPPVALGLLVPLGFVSPKTGMVAWMLALIGSLLLSVWIIWVLSGRPDSGYHFGGYLFAPAVACLLLGQIGTFLLLGTAAFLYLRDSRPFLAGVALLPCVWKPHLFLPFFIVLCLWSVIRKEWVVFAGFLTAAVSSCALTMCFDPNVWSQYQQMVAGTATTLKGYVPTLSVTLRFLIAPRAVWLQYVPEVAACIWAVWYFWSRRSRWSWLDHGSWVLLVSSLCTPYAWFTDEAILLPAVLLGVYRAADSNRALWPIALLGFAALIEVCALGHIASTHYLWTAPAWLAWYAYATGGGSERVQPACNSA
jgi:hypothetical protein